MITRQPIKAVLPSTRFTSNWTPIIVLVSTLSKKIIWVSTLSQMQVSTARASIEAGRSSAPRREAWPRISCNGTDYVVIWRICHGSLNRGTSLNAFRHQNMGSIAPQPTAGVTFDFRFFEILRFSMYRTERVLSSHSRYPRVDYADTEKNLLCITDHRLV